MVAMLLCAVLSVADDAAGQGVDPFRHTWTRAMGSGLADAARAVAPWPTGAAVVAYEWGRVGCNVASTSSDGRIRFTNADGTQRAEVVITGVSTEPPAFVGPEALLPAVEDGSSRSWATPSAYAAGHFGGTVSFAGQFQRTAIDGAHDSFVTHAHSASPGSASFLWIAHFASQAGAPSSNAASALAVVPDCRFFLGDGGGTVETQCRTGPLLVGGWYRGPIDFAGVPIAGSADEEGSIVALNPVGGGVLGVFTISGPGRTRVNALASLHDDPSTPGAEPDPLLLVGGVFSSATTDFDRGGAW